METSRTFLISFILCPFLVFLTDRAKEESSCISIFEDSAVSETSNGDSVSARFPFLADILDLYYDYYLTMPNDFNSLDLFADTIYATYPEELYYYNLLKEHTFPAIKENGTHLFFKENECNFQLWMKEENDTILLYNTDRKPCCILDSFPYPNERIAIINRLVYSIPKAFNAENEIVIVKRELSDFFLNEMKSIYLEYKVNRKKAILMDYKQNDGLLDYCNKEKIGNNDPYFLEIESRLKTFCERNGIYRLIFYIYCPR